MAFKFDWFTRGESPQTTSQVIGSMHMMMAVMPEGAEKQSLYAQVHKLARSHQASQYRPSH